MRTRFVYYHCESSSLSSHTIRKYRRLLLTSIASVARYVRINDICLLTNSNNLLCYIRHYFEGLDIRCSSHDGPSMLHRMELQYDYLCNLHEPEVTIFIDTDMVLNSRDLIDVLLSHAKEDFVMLTFRNSPSFRHQFINGGLYAVHKNSFLRDMQILLEKYQAMSDSAKAWWGDQDIWSEFGMNLNVRLSILGDMVYIDETSLNYKVILLNEKGYNFSWSSLNDLSKAMNTATVIHLKAWRKSYIALFDNSPERSLFTSYVYKFLFTFIHLLRDIRQSTFSTLVLLRSHSRTES